MKLGIWWDYFGAIEETSWSLNGRLNTFCDRYQGRSKWSGKASSRGVLLYIIITFSDFNEVRGLSNCCNARFSWIVGFLFVSTRTQLRWKLYSLLGWPYSQFLRDWFIDFINRIAPPCERLSSIICNLQLFLMVARARLTRLSLHVITRSNAHFRINRGTRNYRKSVALPAGNQSHV